MNVYQIDAFQGADALRRVERAEPTPGAGEAVVRARAVALNYRDLLVTRGQYSRNLPLPLVPCSDASGEVVAVGPGVTRVAPGDRVAAAFMPGWIEGEPSETKARSALGGGGVGVLAEQFVVPAEGLVRVPDALSFEEAATLPCAAVTAWHALIVEGQVRPGDTVLTLGTGGVSIFALQFARLAGARVLATSSRDDKLERVRALGASDGINYTTTPDWDAKVRELTGGLGVDHVVEVGGAGTLARSLRAVRMRGRVSLIGVLSGAGEVNPTPLLMKNVRLQGIFVGSRTMLEDVVRAVATHALKPVIDRVFPFDEAPDAFRHLASGAHFGKVVIRI